MTPEEIIQLIRLFFEIVGAATIVAAIIGGLATFFGWTMGIFMVMKRLGLGRWYRKVLIVSDASNGESLKDDLVSSGVFREKNIRVVGENHVSEVKNYDLILLDYWAIEDTEKSLTAIKNKRSHAGLVVYSPMKKGRIADKVTERINDEPFTTLVNMRGRLVNDLLITLMSTSYDKKRR